MSKSTAWGIANVSPAARSIAEQAADRAGLTLEEWLNQAIAEQAFSAQVAEPNRASVGEGSASDALGREPVDDFLRPGVAWRAFRIEGESARDLQERLKTTAQLTARPANRAEEVDSRSRASKDSLVDPGSGVASSDGTSRWESASVTRGHGGQPASAKSPEARSCGRPDTGTASPQNADSRELSMEPAPAGNARPTPRLFNLESALSQITSRRRALDAHQAHDGLESHSGIARDPIRAIAQAPRPAPSPPAGSSNVLGPLSDASLSPATAGPPSPAGELLRGLRTLSGKLEALRSEWSEGKTGDREIALLREQISAVRSSLPSLAPREAVEALEASLGALVQRVDALGRTERRQPAHACMDSVGDELDEASGAYDAKIVLADIERQLQALGAKLDALADAVVRPEAIEPVQRQTAAMYDLLAAAAQRASPFDHLEALIVGLADRVEGLATSVPQTVELRQAIDLLAALGRQIENANAPRVLDSIERRLGEISSRLDREAAPDLHDLDGMARRIEAVMEHSQIAARSVEASLSELNAKLEAAGMDRLTELIRDLNARLEAAGLRERDLRPIEQILTEIVEKVDRIPDAWKDSGAPSSIDWELKSLRSAIEEGFLPPFDRISEEVAQRLERRFGEAIPERFDQLNDRLDAMSGRFGGVETLERAARDVLEELRGREPAGGADVAEQVSALRQQSASAERRMEALLQGMQDLLNRLIDRLPVDDPDPSLPTERRISNEAGSFSTRAAESTPLSALSEIPLRRSRTRLDLGESRANPAPSREPEDEFLLEPGAGAPQRVQAGVDATQTPHWKTNPAVSAHIAAARRAAQSAVAENSEAKPSAAWPRVERHLQRAKRFTIQHKRSLLLAAALVLAVAAVARFMGSHGPLIQKSALEGPAVKATSMLAQPRALGGAGAAGAAPPSVDDTPTGSIVHDFGAIEKGSERQTPPPELSTAIPSGAPAALREAVLAGSPPAQYDLARRLYEGHGLSQDQAVAAFWFERAAAAGFAPAEFRLGALYQKGVGVHRDPAAAKRWYTAAAQSGNARAAHNLGVISAEPVGEKPDYAEAAKWFQRAAEMGVRDSQFNLAVLYARGLGVEQDLRQSWLWFSLAAVQGDAEAGRKRDEVAAKMDSDALAAAGDLLAKFRATEPDPAANDIAAVSRNWVDTVQPAPAAVAPPSRGSGSRSGP